MAKSTLTREWLQHQISAIEAVGITDSNTLAAFKLALAALDSEPVRNPVLAYADSYRDMSKQSVESVPIWSVITDLERNIAPLYRHAQQPVVEREPIAWLNDAYLARGVVDGEAGSEDAGPGYIPVYREAGPQPALVVPPEQYWEELCRQHPDMSIGDAIIRAAWWNHCRAAMLQASPVCTCPSGDGSLRWPCPVHAGSSLAIPDGWTGNDKANAALMMLDRIETADPVDDDRIDGIKRIVRELAAAPHDTPALNPVQSVVTVPGKWIPVSERMPENDGAYLCWDNRYVTTYAFIFGAWQANQFIAKNITHWMPLPAGPQEVR